MNRREAIFFTLAGISGTALGAEVLPAVESQANHPELDNVRALLKAHDTAMTNQDLDGVLATMTPKATVLGTGPGEIWSGPDEIKTAYEHFFEGFDKGQQAFDYQFKIGGLDSVMGWLVASGNVKGKKDGKDFEYPLNLSLTVSKSGGQWKIVAMHFSTLAGEDKL